MQDIGVMELILVLLASVIYVVLDGMDMQEILL